MTVAYSRTNATRARVVVLGIVDSVVDDPAKSAEDADLVVIGVPVGASGAVAAALWMCGTLAGLSAMAMATAIKTSIETRTPVVSLTPGHGNGPSVMVVRHCVTGRRAYRAGDKMGLGFRR